MMEVLFNLELQSGTNDTLLCLQELLRMEVLFNLELQSGTNDTLLCLQELLRMEVLFNLELQSGTNDTLLCLQELLRKGDGGWRRKKCLCCFLADQKITSA